MAFSLEALDPIPIVDIRYCRTQPTSIVIPKRLYMTHIDCSLCTVDGEPFFHWDGRKTALMDHATSPTVIAHMSRKTHSHINMHKVFLESRFMAKHQIMRILVDFPALYHPAVTSVVESIDGERVSFHVNGEWSERSAILSMSRSPFETPVVVARIRSHGAAAAPFSEYVVDVVPGVDVAAVMLVCIAIDRIASVLRGVIY
ncbi:hypothetical protein SPRG_08052 [Saprolegnia parasitica CBS 223.65]|uniref:Tubby C-terminal domain-containing protein n=1 Tax=Saprolegnia parasitica (strain CBS 223.65) TaxID=695850 RepID=A0A067C824_SAPPC|nr:hypothetical protein SPRG_08052 [Saprolegnia parasitica CBS 223.65]KDO26648.1 hypothetical protein SPRG_08052 [Saprolegnia parasitica CBS 223.65]|eukprot:XP_012202785.1 hypothetical protein SPRG_08052 [Saprolegnia parasitica CBS 223.65]